MELILEKSLEHQQNAVDAVADVFAGVRIDPPVTYYENPILDVADARLFANVAEIQARRGVPAEMRGAITVPHDYMPLDVKMETGTGKTYVYTKTIFELHRRYGFNKFVVAVPSLAIKAGASQFMTDGAARKHFADVCGYDTTLDIQVLEAVKAAKKSHREAFPAAVWEFVKATKEAKRRISVLLVNMQLLSNAKMLGKEYDSMFETMRRPFDAIRATRPIVIIDEPHRFERTQEAYKKIETELRPQCVIRYGATFPEQKLRGKKGLPKPKDYRNLLYDLNACKAFNDGLVKGIAKEHLVIPGGENEMIKLISAEARQSARFQRIVRGKTTKTVEVKQGDSLGIVHEAFEGIEVAEIGARDVTLSNGLVRKINDPIAAGPHMQSYQDGMIQLALDRHFETERENFRRGTKIKTLALFFISDIRSYRDADGYLRERFERYLKERIEKTLAELTPGEDEYREFLEASVASLPLCHGGYFAEDKTAADEATAKEVEEILFGKKQLLSFRDDAGKWNVRRFLFSKWTLREGWDNPNVFTIVKLRSCGSETSLLQEVGRGLRLPVDENGNRVSGEDFRLNYIVDFTEADFAERLVNQINAEVATFTVITEEKLAEVAKKRGTTPEGLFVELLTKGLVDVARRVVDGKQGALLGDYPEFGTGVRRDAVRDRNKKKDVCVKVRKEQFDALRRLWELLNQRYMLFFEGETEKMLERALPSVWEKNVFAESTLTGKQQIVKTGAGGMSVIDGASTQYHTDRRLPYGEFLKRLFAATRVPIRVLHASLCRYAAAHGTPKAEHFTETTVVNFKNALDDWKVENLQGFIHYERADVPVVRTELTNDDGTVVAEVSQGRIGRHLAEGTPSAKYLYDAKAYDSDLELEDIGCDEIVAPVSMTGEQVAFLNSEKLPKLEGANAAFMKACEGLDVKGMEAALAAGADVFAIGNGESAAEMIADAVWFSKMGNSSIPAEKCLELGRRAFECLIAHGGDLDFAGYGSCTALYEAGHGFPELMKMLLDMGADPNAASFFWIGGHAAPPLDHVIADSFVLGDVNGVYAEMEDMLCKAGGICDCIPSLDSRQDLNEIDSDDLVGGEVEVFPDDMPQRDRCLIQAVRRGYGYCMALAVRWGADTALRDEQGRSLVRIFLEDYECYLTRHHTRPDEERTRFMAGFMRMLLHGFRVPLDCAERTAVEVVCRRRGYDECLKVLAEIGLQA